MEFDGKPDARPVTSPFTPPVAADPIDIVYLWVDGADPAWQARRERAFAQWQARGGHELAVYGNVLGRYRDNDELRFSLRALERFFPAHGHVHIVTDDQAPRWLRPGPGLSIVDHRTLMPAASLPVYDSAHIESYLHRIPGLAERFFYLNDDTFFGAPVDPHAWFGPPLTVAIESAPPQAIDDSGPEGHPQVVAARQSADWLQARDATYRHDPRLFAHSPRPMLRSAMAELERLAPDVFARVRATVFRARGTPHIVSDLLIRWMVHTGLARQAEVDPVYIATGDDAAPARFAELARQFGQRSFFCINDTCDDAAPDDPRLRRVAEELARLLPEPSRFERRDG